MLFTITVNQKAIYDQGLIDHIDFKDMAIINYIHAWSMNPRKKTIIHNEKEYFWLNYRTLLTEIPMLKIKTKRNLIVRINKLKKLNLIDTVKTKNNTLYVKGMFYQLFSFNEYGFKGGDANITRVVTQTSPASGDANITSTNININTNSLSRKKASKSKDLPPFEKFFKSEWQKIIDLKYKDLSELTNYVLIEYDLKKHLKYMNENGFADYSDDSINVKIKLKTNLRKEYLYKTKKTA